MTAPAKPLTADEVAAWRDIATDEPIQGWQPTAVLRLIATIEQQAGKIAKLRYAVEGGIHALRGTGVSRAEALRVMQEALAATEPKP